MAASPPQQQKQMLSSPPPGATPPLSGVANAGSDQPVYDGTTTPTTLDASDNGIW